MFFAKWNVLCMYNVHVYVHMHLCKNFTIHQLVQCEWRICEMMISHNLTVYVQYYTHGSFHCQSESCIDSKTYHWKKNLFKFLSAQNFRNHSKIHWTMRKKIRYYQYNIFLPSKYFLDMFHVHLLYTIREIQIYITDYMQCRLALFYIWQMTRVR